MSNEVFQKQIVLEQSIYSPFFRGSLDLWVHQQTVLLHGGACSCDLAPGTTYPESLPNAFYIRTDNKRGKKKRREGASFPLSVCVSFCRGRQLTHGKCGVRFCLPLICN